MVEAANPTGNPVLAVYTGETLPDLVQLAAADAGEGNTAEALTFEAVSGTTYFIAVDDFSEDGAASAGGLFTLNLSGDLIGGDDPYSIWIAQFSDLSGDDALPGAIPLGDGVSNLLKLILGLDPTVRIADDPNKGNFPQLVEFNGNPALRYTVDSDNLGSGELAIQHGGEISIDLDTWVDVAPVNETGNTFVIEIPRTGSDSRFARIIGTIPSN